MLVVVAGLSACSIIDANMANCETDYHIDEISSPTMPTTWTCRSTM